MDNLAAIVDFHPPDMAWLVTEIALEGEDSPALESRLSELVSSWRRQCRDFLFRKESVPGLKISHREVDKALDQVRYIDVAQMEIYVPVGLKVNYLRAIEVLSSAQEQLGTIEKRLLIPFYRWLGEAMARPSALGELSAQKHFQFLDCASVNQQLDHLFDQQSLSDKATYQSLIERNSDWPVLIEQLSALIEQHNQLKRTVLTDAVADITERVDLLMPTIRAQVQSGGLSPASKMALSNALYDLAQEVTLYTRLNFLITALRKAVHDSFEKLKALGRGK